MKILYYFLGICVIGIILYFAIARLSVTTSYEPYKHVVIELENPHLGLNIAPCIAAIETENMIKDEESFKLPLGTNPYKIDRNNRDVFPVQALAKWTLYQEDSSFNKLTSDPLQWSPFFTDLARNLRLNTYSGLIIDCTNTPLEIQDQKFFNHLIHALRTLNLSAISLYSEDESHQRLQIESDAVLGYRNRFSPTYLKRSDKNYPENGLFTEENIKAIIHSPDSAKWAPLPKTNGHLPPITPAPAFTEDELKMAEILGMKKTGHNHLTLGKIFIDRVKKEVLVPVTLNLSTGYVEVILCNPKGRVHESILTTDVSPKDLQMALYLLGFDNGVKKERSRLDLLVFIEGSKTPIVVDEWIREHESKKQMNDSGYLFIGSASESGVDLATRDGNLININSMDKNTILMKELSSTDTAQHEAIQSKMPYVLMGEYVEPNNEMLLAPGRNEVAEELQMKGTLIIKEYKRDASTHKE